MSLGFNHRRVLLKDAIRKVHKVKWDDIHDNSYVVVTAAEGSGTNPEQPARFIGGAGAIGVRGITPQEGEIEFELFWEFDVQHPDAYGFLNIWVDITILDKVIEFADNIGRIKQKKQKPFREPIDI